MFGFAQLDAENRNCSCIRSDTYRSPTRTSDEQLTGFTRQAGEPFPKCSIQTLDESRVQDAGTMREQKQFLRLHYHPMGHLARDIDHPLFLGTLDHCANVQLLPDFQTISPDASILLDLLTEGPTNTVEIDNPAVC